MTPRPRPRDAIGLMEGYHSPQIEVDVRLNTNESPDPPPESFSAAVADAIGSVAWNRYPDREAMELRRDIGSLHGVGPEQVFAANGSNEVLQTLLLTYGGPGRSAAMFEPTYALHSHLARITGTDVVLGTRRDDFALDLDEVERVVGTARPAVTFLCSPNNPTGVVDPPSEVDRVLESVRAAGGILCVDEAYAQFAPHSALDLLDDDVALVVTRTYSKTWAMAAARLGYLIGPAWLVDELQKVVLPYHLDAMTQLAGRLAIVHRDAMDERVGALVRERERVFAALCGLTVHAWPSGANFILFRPLATDGPTVWRELVDRSVLVRNCASWPGLAGCLRVTIGTPEENDRFIAALGEILR